MDKDTQLPAEVRIPICPECGGLNGGHGNRRCSLMTLKYAQQEIIDTEQKWIKINSLQAKISQGVYLRLKKIISFNQGRVAVLKLENNKLRKGAVEYATKLHQAEQENAQLKRWKMEAAELLTPIHAYVHKHIERSLGQCSVKLVLERCKQFEQASALLTEVLVMNEMWGDLPGEFIEKVKTFLDGTK